jgi:hypothetical protein
MALFSKSETRQPTSNGVNVGPTDTARIDSNVNVALAELLQFELNEG